MAFLFSFIKKSNGRTLSHGCSIPNCWLSTFRTVPIFLLDHATFCSLSKNGGLPQRSSGNIDWRSIAIPGNKVIRGLDLDGFFGADISCQYLHVFWRKIQEENGPLAAVVALARARGADLVGVSICLKGY